MNKKKKLKHISGREALTSFRIPEEVADLLENEAEKQGDATTKLSRHKLARKLFAVGLEKVYGIKIS